MCMCLRIYHVEQCLHIIIIVSPDRKNAAVIGATKKGGSANPRLLSFTFPYVKIDLLIWDSGLQLFMKFEGN